MNNDRRKRLDEIKEKLESFDALFEEVKEMVKAIKSEEEEAYDNLPESLREGEKGGIMQSAIDELDNAIYAFDDFEEVVNSINEFIDSAKGE